MLPFSRFPDADARARPGDALDRRGHGHRPDRSAWPSPRASWRPATGCPRAGTVFLSLADRDKATGVEAAAALRRARLRDRRHRRAPPTHLRGHGHRRSPRVVAKLGEPTGTDAVELIAAGKVAAGRQQPAGPRARGPTAPTSAPRPASHGVPLLTTAAAGLAAANGMADWASHALRVRTCRSTTGRRADAAERSSRPCAGRRAGDASRPARRRPDDHGRVGRRCANPCMTASGTAGHGAELARYVDLAPLGAVVVKSLSAEPWPGNPAPRVHETAGRHAQRGRPAGPGVEAWLRDELPAAARHRGPVVASIWGRTVEDYARGRRAAGRRARRGRRRRGQPVVPEPRGPRRDMFAHSPDGRPRRRWRPPPAAAGRAGPSSARTSTDLVPIADAARRRRRRGGHAGQHRAGHGHRPRHPALPAGQRRGRAVGPGHPPGRGAGRARRARRAARPARSSASAAWSTRESTPSSCCWPAPRRSRSARPPSPIPRARPPCCDDLEDWCRRHRIARRRAN